MFPRLMIIFISASLVSCATSQRLDLAGVSTRLHTPSLIQETMARFDIEGAPAFGPPDGQIVGHWLNRIGYVQSEHRITRIYKGDGTWAANDGSGDFVTLQADGLRWIYEVARLPDGSVAGRSLRIYTIDGDQMLARFQNRHTGWEFWERAKDKLLTTKGVAEAE